MDIRNIWALMAPVTWGGGNPGQILARSGIVLVHIAAAGLATATLPIICSVIAIFGLALYMIGTHRTMQAAEGTHQVFRA